MLGRRSISINLSSAVKRPTPLPENSTILIREDGDGAPLAYSFQYGNGKIFYTAFHNHEQTSEIEEALFRLLLLFPIAEATGRTVTETYTGLIAKEDKKSRNTEIENQPKEAKKANESGYICKNCGTTNEKENKFCNECGYRLDN